MITAVTILVALPFLIAFFIFLTNSLAGAMEEEKAFCQFIYAALCLLAVIAIIAITFNKETNMNITELPDQEVPHDWNWHTSCEEYHPYQGKHFRMRLIGIHYKTVVEGTLVDIKIGASGQGCREYDFIVYKDNSGKTHAINVDKHLANSTIVFDNAEVLFFSDIQAYPTRLPTSLSDILDLIKK